MKEDREKITTLIAPLRAVSKPVNVTLRKRRYRQAMLLTLMLQIKKTCNLRDKTRRRQALV